MDYTQERGILASNFIRRRTVMEKYNTFINELYLKNHKNKKNAVYIYNQLTKIAFLRFDNRINEIDVIGEWQKIELWCPRFLNKTFTKKNFDIMIEIAKEFKIIDNNTVINYYEYNN